MASDPSLIAAIKAGDLAAVKDILATNPTQIKATTANGVSALLLAVYYGHTTIVDALLQEGVPLNVFEAAAVGDLQAMTSLLDRDPDLANAVAPDGFYPLGLAAFFGKKTVAKLLLEYGAKVNAAADNEQGVMPLHSAVAGGHLEIARLLLDRRALVNAKQEGGFTPLHGAAQNGQIEMIELLIERGADVSLADDDGHTPHDLAVAAGHTEAAALLAGA